MSYTTDITNETERALGYTLTRTVDYADSNISVFVEISHRGDVIECLSHHISDVAAARAHDFVADEIARNAAEADIQAEIDELLGQPAPLSYNEACALNERRELGAALLFLTPVQMKATACNIVAGSGKGTSWTEALARLEKLRAEAYERDMADALKGVDVAAKDGQWVDFQRNAHDKSELGADCPYCVGGVIVAGRWNPVKSEPWWEVIRACDHARGIAEGDSTRAGKVFFIKPATPPAPSTLDLDGAVKLADEMGLFFTAGSSLTDLNARAYAAAIKAANALGYDNPGHIHEMTEPQFIAAVQAIAAMEDEHADH